ncbi:MAG: DNA-directed RNA polymerase subunit alpha [Planctomycetota bacterium]
MSSKVKWRGLELPGRVELDESVSNDTFGRFTAEPFERGFGTTVGNSLRRILLSSIEGAAVTRVKLKGADHEFSSLPGIMEDVTDVILNTKALIITSDAVSDEPQVLTLRGEKAGELTGADIECPEGLEVLNKDLVIATLTEDVEFEMDLTVQVGRGYKTDKDHIADAEESGEAETGFIYVDSNFSPVTRVRYNTEAARVGQRTDYDRLVLEVWTDGTVTPELAVVEAAKVLRKHLNPFVQYFELGDQLASEEAVQGLQEAQQATSASAAAVDPDLESKLGMTVQELDLSVRANNCLESARISTVRELVQRTDSDLLKVRSFGKTSLREVKRRLADMGLSLGMDLEALKNGPPAGLVADAGIVDDGGYTMPDDEEEAEVPATEEA